MAICSPKAFPPMGELSAEQADRGIVSMRTTPPGKIKDFGRVAKQLQRALKLWNVYILQNTISHTFDISARRHQRV